MTPTVERTVLLSRAARVACALAAGLALVRVLGGPVPPLAVSVVLALAVALFGAATFAVLRRATGPRHRLLLGIGWAAVAAAAAQIAAIVYLALALPARFPTLDLMILLLGTHPALVAGLASAIGRHHGPMRDEQIVDALLLIGAAAIVALGLVMGAGADALPTGGKVGTFLVFWRWLPMIELMLVAFLLSVQGARLGVRTSTGLALGTVGFAIASLIQVRSALADPSLALTQNDFAWAATLLLFTLVLDERRTATDTPPRPARAIVLEPTTLDVAETRGRLVVIAILIAAAGTVALGFLPARHPALAITVAAFGVLLAARAWLTVRRQASQTRELTLSVTAERAVASELERRVGERTAELAEAQRVLQRMWVLGQQIALELNPERVLQRFVEAATDIAQADGAVLALVTDERRARVVAATGAGQPLLNQMVPLEESAMGRVIRSGRPCSGDPERDIGLVYRPLHERAGVELHSILVLPLQRRSETIGAVSLVARAADHFEAVDVERITSLIDLSTVALANAELVETLRQTEWRFRTLFRSAPDAVLTVLQSGRIREANEAIRALIGEDPVRVVGRFLTDFVDPADRDVLAERIEAAFTGQAVRIEVRFTDGAGARTTVDLAASRLPEADPPAVLIIARDISREREMRARLMETERLAAVGELVAGVAHEVNNPLSSISAFAQLMLRDGGLSASQRDSVEVIQSEAVRASHVVRDLLAFARRSEPRYDHVDLNQVVDRSLRLRAFELNANRVKVEPSLALDLPAVMGDARQLQQVVLNLVTNAMQAMGGEGGRLSLATRASDGSVVLEIADTGGGIPDEARARIFEPFFTTKEEGQGTGLGLSVSYGIVTSHGGTLELAETSERGTRFILKLPAAPDGARAADAPAAESFDEMADVIDAGSGP